MQNLPHGRGIPPTKPSPSSFTPKGLAQYQSIGGSMRGVGGLWGLNPLPLGLGCQSTRKTQKLPTIFPKNPANVPKIFAASAWADKTAGEKKMSAHVKFTKMFP